MERQHQNSRRSAERDGTGPNAGTKAGALADETIKDLQKDVKELSNTLKEIKNLIKTLTNDKNRKIPGVE